MPIRKVTLVKDELYHIYDRSIADFKIFNSNNDYVRMRNELLFYSVVNPGCSFSSIKKFDRISDLNKQLQNKSMDRLIDIIAYCIMPTHFHIILKELRKGGISKFMELILKSYSQYFNMKYNRKGPLWESRFNNVLIDGDDQFVHLTRYIHLNPVTAYLVDDPADWEYSSYREYMGLVKDEARICHFSDHLNMDILSYKKFVNDQIAYQRELALIKKSPS